jgi:D-glycero-D-manno-heptose 1,7-bisphosphate phosphatase
MKEKVPAVFLDRDGTIIHETNYLKNIEDIKLFECSARAVKKLNNNNIPVIMVSNQSGVARGYFSEESVQLINKTLNEMLKKYHAGLDGFYYCPHHPKGTVEQYAKECNCRKPLSGMIDQALKDFKHIDVSRSYVIGDKECDVKMAKNAGCKGVLVLTGYGKDLDYRSFNPDYVANDLENAVDWILEDLKTI